MHAASVLRRLSLSTTLALVTALSSAEIRYTVQLAPDHSKLKVTVSAPVQVGTPSIAFQMPRWSPGSYVYGDFGKQVQDVAVTDSEGKPLPFEHPDFSTWTVANPPVGQVSITYSVKADVDHDVLHYSGPSTYMYVDGRKQEGCRLTLLVPSDWPVAVGLNESPAGQKTYVAPDYDVLADNPVSSGRYVADEYTAAGKPHYIVLRGSAEDVASIDRERLRRVTKFVSEMQINFFGGVAPYDKYVWHFVAFPRRDGGWGLEHLSSTQIGLATGFGPGTVGVISHEFFHLWNVKRIRSKPLGPFNYQELPQTGALWWLEGVTDYYGHLLLSRYGWADDERILNVLAQTVAQVRRNPARLEVSPYEASMRVRDANDGRGNSSGYRISYYDLGWLAGFCLDMAIRESTQSRRSLDDVELALWKKYGQAGQPGFEEAAIREELVRLAGPQLGTLYDKIVMQPGELPVEDALAKIGVLLAMKDQPYGRFGFTYAFDREKGGLLVSDVEPGEVGLKKGDFVTAIDGQEFSGQSSRTAFMLISAKLSSPEIGRVISLRVKREGVPEPLTIELKSIAGSRKAWVATPDPKASHAQLAMRKSWLTAPSNWTAPPK